METFTGRGLFVGDLNNTPDSAMWQQIRHEDWIDMWAQLHPGEKGYTFESNNPTIRIDYAWAKPELVPFVGTVEIVAGRASADALRASDHFGLLVTLNLAT